MQFYHTHFQTDSHIVFHNQSDHSVSNLSNLMINFESLNLNSNI